MEIHGKYEIDENFIIMYADNCMYTIARNTGNWNSLKVGERSYIGGVLTQERYNEFVSACSKEGTFELSEK